MDSIGVFDSGIGGLSMANAIQRVMPSERILFVNDSENMPYGDKTPAQLLEMVAPILESMVQHGARVIVIACNTVSTTIIDELRARISVPLIATEPMIKPAAEQTKTGVIAVCATPGTLASKRYKWLKETYAADVTVIEPACNKWAMMIEQNQVNEDIIREQIDVACDQKADVIVLGCTHYHWIEEEIKALAADRAVVIQPESAVIAQLQRVLAEL